MKMSLVYQKETIHNLSYCIGRSVEWLLWMQKHYFGFLTIQTSIQSKFKKLKHCMMEENVCRICMIRSEVFEYCNLMGKTFFKNIRLCDAFKLITGLDISDEDDFPKVLCSRCEDQLKNAFHLRQLAESSSKHFAAISSNNQPRILNSLKRVAGIDARSIYRVGSTHLDSRNVNVTLQSETVVFEDPTCASNYPEVYMLNLNVADGDIEVRPRNYHEKESLSITDPMAKNPIFVSDHTNFEYNDQDADSDAVSFLLRNKHLKKEDGPKSEAYENRKFGCSVCSKRFIGKSNLLDHLRYHANIRNFKCKFCDKDFVQSSSLKSHLRTHTAEKPYICSYCDKGFAQKSALTVHVRTHTQERNYACEICKKAFMTTGDLVKHKLTHELIKKFACNICGMRSAQKVNVKKHKLNVHGIVEDKLTKEK